MTKIGHVLSARYLKYVIYLCSHIKYTMFHQCIVIKLLIFHRLYSSSIKSLHSKCIPPGIAQPDVETLIGKYIT